MKQQMRGDESACVTFDKQAYELLLRQTRFLHTLKFRQLPPVSSTTQIHAFKPGSRKGWVLYIWFKSSWLITINSYSENVLYAPALAYVPSNVVLVTALASFLVETCAG
jgi:hypothetical protein